MIYDKKPDPFYMSHAWKALRRQALQRDNYLCQDCMAAKARGEMIRPRNATVVHHILPRDRYPEQALNLENLVSLCEACHNKRHPEKGLRSERAQSCNSAAHGIRIIKV